MALVIPPGFALASMQLRNSGDPKSWYVTHGVDLTEIGGDYFEAAGNVQTAWSANVFAQLSTSTTFVDVTLRIGQDGGDPLTYIYAVGLNGGASAAKLPQNCALLVDKLTGRGGRTGRGRMFIPNILVENDVDNVGNISGGTVSALQGDFNTLLAALSDPMTGPPVPMVLFHNAGAPGGTTPTPVDSLYVQSTIATQRRRLRS